MVPSHLGLESVPSFLAKSMLYLVGSLMCPPTAPTSPPKPLTVRQLDPIKAKSAVVRIRIAVRILVVFMLLNCGFSTHRHYPGDFLMPWGETLPVLKVGALGMRDARRDGIAGEVGGVVDAEFFHQMSAMFFDRFDTDAEYLCGLFVGATSSNALEHLNFTRS